MDIMNIVANRHRYKDIMNITINRHKYMEIMNIVTKRHNSRKLRIRSRFKRHMTAIFDNDIAVIYYIDTM